MIDGVGPDEPVVVLDEAGVPTGESLPLVEALARGAWHGAIAVWGVRDSGEVLLSRLPREHVLEPSRLAPTATALAGLGSPAEAVTAAVRTWLGGPVQVGEPRYLGSFRSERRYSTGSGDTIVRQQQDAYLVQIEDPLEELSLHPKYVDTVYELPAARAIALMETGGHAPAPGFDAMGRVSNALLVEADLPSQGRAALLEQLLAVAASLDDDVAGAGHE
ncbi:MAG TPA: hypothetical protein VFF10_07010 [Trueperaceae bacterium]|nr:hypothetical protein [Trueperaceae bacterium]